MKFPVFEFDNTKYITTTFEEVNIMQERRATFTQEELDEIVEKAVDKALDKAIDKVYSEIGKSLIHKLIWGVVLTMLGVAVGHQIMR